MRELAPVAPSARPAGHPVVRYALTGAGGMFVGIGVIGIFVPLLPTTVFLLIAAACFGRSSPRAHHWLTTNRWFGTYLHNYSARRGATVSTKITSIGALWIGIGAAVFFLATPLWLTASLGVIAAAVTTHLLMLQTLRD
ncbi:MAG: YbaN family protein [Dehalococcoidia bacterium]|nr:YbaN family protein [Dehalococcoidia bacterium]MCA9843996.1 YbaN family protein [Dehalococcoidia bacterium]MCA9852885.1 YbaN family protein [Dehalococcoidia bacterium]